MNLKNLLKKYGPIISIAAILFVGGVVWSFFNPQTTDKMLGVGRTYIPPYPSLNGLTASAVGNWFNSMDHRHTDFFICTSGNANGTVKIYGSLLESPPTLTSTSTYDNQYDTIQVVDKQNGASIAGDTGIVFSGTDDCLQFEIDDNVSAWYAMYITSYTTGTFYGYFVSADNE